MSSTIVKRYARALFSFAVERKALDEVYSDSLQIRNVAELSAEFARFLANPVIPAEKQKKILESIFKSRVNVETMRFLVFLVNKEKLCLLSEILLHFEDKYHEYKNIKKARIISACPMSAKHVEAICQKLKRFFKCDFETEVVVDSSILGGFMIKVEDMVFDLTVSKQLENYRRSVLMA